MFSFNTLFSFKTLYILFGVIILANIIKIITLWYLNDSTTHSLLLSVLKTMFLIVLWKQIKLINE